jgi:hypothetical protein
MWLAAVFSVMAVSFSIYYTQLSGPAQATSSQVLTPQTIATNMREWHSAGANYVAKNLYNTAVVASPSACQSIPQSDISSQTLLLASSTNADPWQFAYCNGYFITYLSSTNANAYYANASGTSITAAIAVDLALDSANTNVGTGVKINSNQYVSQLAGGALTGIVTNANGQISLTPSQSIEGANGQIVALPAITLSDASIPNGSVAILSQLQ